MSRLNPFQYLHLFIAILVICINQSCSRAPVEIAPWDYVAQSPTQTWTPQTPEKTLASFIDELEGIPNKQDTLSLAELIDIALKNNPKTKESWYKARQAAALYGVSKADYYPDISFQGDVSKLHQSLGIIEAGSTNSASSAADEVESETSYGGHLDLKYTLFDFGVRSAKADAAMRALQHANWAHNEQIQKTMQQVSSDYYDYLYNKANLEALYVDLEDAQVSFIAAKQKLDTGVADVSEMLQARTQYLQKQLQVSSQVGVVDNSFVALVRDLGLPADIEFQLSGFPDHPDLHLLNADIEKLISIAKDQRPDIRAALATVEQKQADLSKAKADRWPKFTANAQVGRRWYGDDLGTNTNYSLQLELTFPIFSGFMYTNQIRAAEEAVEVATDKLRNIELSAIKDVMTYHNDFLTAKDLIYYSQEYIESAEEEFTAVLSNYEMGTKDILDVLSAQASLADARAKYIQTKKDLFVAITNLAYAIGTLDASEYESDQFHFLMRKAHE